MKTLYLLRHAKAQDQTENQTDFERELTPVGYRQLEEIAHYATSQFVNPELIVASAAVRTTQTAQTIAANCQWNKELIQFHKSLYNAGIKEYARIIQNVPDSIQTAILVGHNPTISDLTGYLSGTEPLELPTAGLVKLTLFTDTWEGVGSGNASIDWVKVPEYQR